MDLAYVEKLVQLLSESAVDEIEIEEEGKKIRVAKNAQPAPLYQAPMISAAQMSPLQAGFAPGMAPANAAGAPAAPAASPAPPPAANNLHEIKSPIVGTFYRAPAPDASPFVQVGTTIEPGSVLCIVEAMKLMNEIEADVAGKIAKIMVENGQPVEYDQTLFLVERV